MTEFNKCTCVKVNKEKMDLIKTKGLNLQDILDKAMNEELNLSEIPNVHNKIDELNNKIEELKIQRDESIADYQKRIDNLMKNLKELKNMEEAYYNKQINCLELEIEYLKKNDRK